MIVVVKNVKNLMQPKKERDRHSLLKGFVSFQTGNGKKKHTVSKAFCFLVSEFDLEFTMAQLILVHPW